MKSPRRRDLLRLLRAGAASTQQELVDALRAAGHDVTQATVSRDLHEIGAVKIRNGQGTKYRLPDQAADDDRVAENLAATLADSAIEIRPAASLVVIITLPGHAAAVARAVDLAGLPHALGTIAGDDTVFVAAPGPAAAGELAQHLLESIASKR